MKRFVRQTLKTAGIILVSLLVIATCTTVPNQESHRVTVFRKKHIASVSMEESYLRYPLVLVHGIGGVDRERFRNYWGRIPDVLRGNGVVVYFGNTDPWSSYETNAEELKTTIENILAETHSEKVNIIAHSKGGIDSRYMIWKYDFGDKVASLTTVSTPHHGSEFADLIYRRRFVHTKLGLEVLEIYGRITGDKHPDMLYVDYELTTGNMEDFNVKVPMDQQVYCQSVYSTMNNGFDNIFLSNSYRYIKKIAGNNDGLVSEYSARWGDNVIKIEGRISHTDIVDTRERKISGINIPDIYVKLVSDLRVMGF